MKNPESNKLPVMNKAEVKEIERMMKEVNSGSLRYNEDKPEMFYWMMWPKSAEAVSRVCEYGATKYDELNYTKATAETNPPKEYVSACGRHLTAACRYLITKNTDDLYDKESGCLHVAHAIWNLMMLIDYIIPVDARRD